MSRYQQIVHDFCKFINAKEINLSKVEDILSFQYQEFNVRIESGESYFAPDHLIVLLELNALHSTPQEILNLNANVNLTKDGYIGTINGINYYFKHLLIPNSPLELSDLIYNSIEVAKLIISENGAK